MIAVLKFQLDLLISISSSRAESRGEDEHHITPTTGDFYDSP